MDTCSLTISPKPQELDKLPGPMKWDPSPLMLRRWLYSAGLIINIQTPPKLDILWGVLSYGAGGVQAEHIYSM